jgi:hypothetical protein
MNEGRKEVGAGRRAQILTPLLARGVGGGGAAGLRGSSPKTGSSA